MIAIVPDVFVWQRYAEMSAGQTIEQILEEKEKQRLASGGIFMWAIGTSFMPQIDRLLRETDGLPLVLFSPTATSGPNSADPEPGRIATWVGGTAPDGSRYAFPGGLSVTTADDGRVRYALVCRSDEPLRIARHGPSIRRDDVVHIESRKRIADSNVTAAVRIADSRTLGVPKYPVTFSARLFEPYLVKLTTRSH